MGGNLDFHATMRDPGILPQIVLSGLCRLVLVEQQSVARQKVSIAMYIILVAHPSRSGDCYVLTIYIVETVTVLQNFPKTYRTFYNHSRCASGALQS